MKRYFLMLSTALAAVASTLAQTMSLSECRNEALKFNETMTTANNAVRQAELDRQIAFTNYLPKLDGSLSGAAKRQLAAEVIFLTHNDRLHEVNLAWHPRAEDLLWVPSLQEAKVSETGGRNVRYRRGLKGRLVEEFSALLREKLPYCAIR
ncbi:MAG: hypothetical protein ACI4A8_04350, partial [Muribaculaceae bacterium]